MSDARGVPGFTHVDHIGLTVPDLDAAVKFYVDVFAGTELYRLGPFDAAQIPRLPDGRDWTEAHINVPGARLSMAMVKIGANMMLELMRYEKPADARPEPPRNCDIGAHHIAFKVENLAAAVEYMRAKGVRVLAGPIVLDQGPCAGLKANYCLDPWGNSLELIEYGELPWMATSPVKAYRP
jgi:catechol 2,3-dioxygenase-like lactoylglutathione lyase family enzyme